MAVAEFKGFVQDTIDLGGTITGSLGQRNKICLCVRWLKSSCNADLTVEQAEEFVQKMQTLIAEKKEEIRIADASKPLVKASRIDFAGNGVVDGFDCQGRQIFSKDGVVLNAVAFMEAFGQTPREAGLIEEGE